MSLASLLAGLVWLSAGHFQAGHSLAGEIVPALTEVRTAAKTEKAGPAATAFITPHHLVSEGLIDKIFSEVAEKDLGAKPGRIILMSPDHFQAGRGAVSVLAGASDIPIDTRGVERLTEAGLAIGTRESFVGEHGISGLLPYAERYFPDAKLLALMAPENLADDSADRLADFLAENFGKDSVFILSSDFSHYLDENLARQHDERAIEVLDGSDYDRAGGLETDFPAGLRLIMKYAEGLGYSDWQTVGRSSFSALSGHNKLADNTSYVAGYFQKGAAASARSANLLFGGDLMLDRDMRSLIDRRGTEWLTEKIGRIFRAQDLNVVNLEGPITGNRTVSQGTAEDQREHFRFTFDPGQASRFLRKNSIKLVSLGNNHLMNFGAEGLAETKKNLESSGTEFFGNPEDGRNFYVINEIGSQKIAVLGYNQFGSWPLEKYLEKIRLAAKESDRVIVYAHWGTEYETAENEGQREKAHAFIAAGADLIIGSHPHVVQPVEVYQGKAIFYSLGNFIFDQYFSEDVRERLVVGVNLDKEGTEFALVPLYLERSGQLVQMDPSRREAFLGRIARGSAVDEKIRNGIMEGTFKLNN